MKNILIILSILIIASQSYAHGESDYGPHQGFVKMPGAFHTEILLDGKNKLKVYLLDMEWKNPTLEKSSLQVTYGQSTKAQCKPIKDFYLCEFPLSIDLTKKGNLKILASRNNQSGAAVHYSLPLKLED